MSTVTDWIDLMPQTVTRNAFLRRGNDGYGGPSYSTTGTSYRARVVAKPTIVTRPDGLELLSTHTMWLATTATIGQEDKISYQGSTFQILEVARYPDEQGQHHVRLLTKG